MKADKRGAAISAYSVHPGFINTPLSRHMSGGGGLAKLWSGLTAVPGLGGALGSKTVPQGAATTVFDCVSPQLEGRSGEYLADCQVRWMGAGAGVCVWVGRAGGQENASNVSHATRCLTLLAPPLQIGSEVPRFWGRTFCAPSKMARDAGLAQALWEKTEQLVAEGLARD